MTGPKTEDWLPITTPRLSPARAAEFDAFIAWQAGRLPLAGTDDTTENGEGEGNVSEEVRAMLQDEFFRGLA